MSTMKVTTCTKLIVDTLMHDQLLLTSYELVSYTKQPYNRVTAALYSLEKQKAVRMIEVYGQQLWAATPETDTRNWKVDERVPESSPRKKRMYNKPRKQRNSKKEV